MTDAKPALSPCPFCGGEAAALQRETLAWRIWCLRPSAVCGIITRDFETKPEAIAAWNRRAPITLDEWEAQAK